MKLSIEELQKAPDGSVYETGYRIVYIYDNYYCVGEYCKTIEGFIAFEKPKNVYGVMCQLKKQEAGWKIVEAYTYKPENVKNIKYLID